MPDLFSYSVISVDSLTENVSRVLVQPITPPGLVYQAGQYVLLKHQAEESPFSIACAPNTDHILEFHVYHPVHNLKADVLLQKALHEKIWTLTGPLGLCTPDKLELNKPIIFIAYGTGFAPIKAMLETLLTQPVLPAIHLYWAMPRTTNFYLLPLIKQWQVEHATFSFSSILLPAEKNWHPSIIDEHVLRDYPDLSNFQVYAAAPKAFISAALIAFTERGLPRAKLFSDLLS